MSRGSGSNLLVELEQTKGVTIWSLFVVRKIDRRIPMPEKMKFDYYYGLDAEQFTFVRLPKMLFTEERFKKLSSDAKILFGIMLDRMSLSVKNQWLRRLFRIDAIGIWGLAGKSIKEWLKIKVFKDWWGSLQRLVNPILGGLDYAILRKNGKRYFGDF